MHIALHRKPISRAMECCLSCGITTLRRQPHVNPRLVLNLPTLEEQKVGLTWWLGIYLDGLLIHSTHPGAKLAWRRATTLIGHNVLTTSPCYQTHHENKQIHFSQYSLYSLLNSTQTYKTTTANSRVTTVKAYTFKQRQLLQFSIFGDVKMRRALPSIFLDSRNTGHWLHQCQLRGRRMSLCSIGSRLSLLTHNNLPLC